MSFDPRSYWENRLSEDWSLQGVGFRRMGRNFNDWAYRLRGERFAAIVGEFIPQHKGARVIDIGSGTGYYIHAWQSLGAGPVVGMDLTNAAVRGLQEKFSDVTIVRNDITEGIGSLRPGSFDIASSMDVMFHIVDQPSFVRALRNVASMLADGGYFVWSDLFIHYREAVHGHIALRSLYRIEELLDQAGFDIVGRRPLLFWMNEPRDASPTVFMVWKGLMWCVSRSEALGGFAGRWLYRLDSYLCWHRMESPSTEVMVCRKRDG